mgnify:CR=1 FL=1
MLRKSRLLFASVDALPQVGGVSLTGHHLANACVDAGAEVDFLVPSGDGHPPDFPARYAVLSDDGANPAACHGAEWATVELPRLISRIQRLHAKRQYHRMIAVHPAYYGQAFHRISEAAGPPSSIMFHGFELRSQLMLRSHMQSVMWRLAGLKPTFRSEMLAALKGADQILVNSRYTGRLVRRGSGRDDLQVIGCGMPLETFRDMRAREFEQHAACRHAARRRLGLNPKDRIVGTLSRLVPQKNVELLIQSLARLPDIKAVIAGTGADEPRLKQKAATLGVADRIIWPGFVSETQKWEWLRAIDAFCLLSRPGRSGEVEGFGIVLLEAATVGTPVIASNCGGMPDVVAHRRTGLLVDHSSVSQLCGAIEMLTRENGPGPDYVAAAQMEIERRFNWCRIAEGLLRQWTNQGALCDNLRIQV